MKGVGSIRKDFGIEDVIRLWRKVYRARARSNKKMDRDSFVKLRI